MPAKRIYRNPREKVVAGVCSGIADYFDVDVAWVRLAFVLSVFASGFGLLAYIVAWIVFPKDERVPGAPVPEPTPASRERSETRPPKAGSGGTRNAVGVVLILLGALFFLDQNFWWFRFDAFWPVILIALGVFLIMRPGSTHAADVPAPVAAAAPSPNSPDASHDSGQL